MSAGKVASQAGHAFLDAYLDTLRIDPQKASEYKLAHHGIKVCLEAKSLHALVRAHGEAIAHSLPCALVTDLGYTSFEGVPTITALGIGPARQAEIQNITKRFQLFD